MVTWVRVSHTRASFKLEQARPLMGLVVGPIAVGTIILHEALSKALHVGGLAFDVSLSPERFVSACRNHSWPKCDFVVQLAPRRAGFGMATNSVQQRLPSYYIDAFRVWAIRLCHLHSVVCPSVCLCVWNRRLEIRSFQCPKLWSIQGLLESTGAIRGRCLRDRGRSRDQHRPGI